MTTPPPQHPASHQGPAVRPGPFGDDRTRLRASANEATPPDPGTRRPTARRRSRVPFVIVVCALAIILGMAGGVAFVMRYGTAAPGGPGASPTPSGPPPDPAAVVRAYLQALARGDAAAALGLGTTRPADTAFTTDAVLAAAVATNPITEINVPAVPMEGPTPAATATVEASYKIGDERITSDFDLTLSGDGYRLDTTTAQWDVSSLRSNRVPLRIAGKKVASDTVTLLPGGYLIRTGLTYLTWGAGDVLLVKKPDAFLTTSGFDITLDHAGARALRSAVRKDLTRCATVKSAKPSGCPFAFTNSSYRIENKTVRWAFTEDPLSTFEPRLSYDKDGVATVNLSLRLRFTANGTRTYNTSRTTIDDTVTSYATATADMTKDTVRITWKD